MRHPIPKHEQREIDARNRNIAREHTRAEVDAGTSSRHEIALLAQKGCIGLEVGVDTGQFSERLWNTGQFSSFESVDKWDDQSHSEAQYWAVAKKLMPYQGIRVWRMTAQNFAQLCPTGKFGFIYMDCYAHTAQDGGGVLDAMWPLLAEGGIFAGDDYDEHWQENFAAVNKFAERIGREITVFDQHMSDERPKYDGHPSWVISK